MAPAAVLAQSVEFLQGVSPQAASLLAELGIRTILDLGASALFAVARQVVDAADGVGPLGSSTPLPSDMIDDSATGLSAAEVARRPIEVLRVLDAQLAIRMTDVFPARSVRDLGLWPAAVAARRLVNLAYGGSDDAVDEESPHELQPRMGRLPVDRVQHDVLLFESVLSDLERMLASSDAGAGVPRPLTVGPAVTGPAGSAPQPLISGEFPLDLTPQLLGQGFAQPGFGFVLTIAQSWYSVGLSLGQLLHSLALAPGEATRIAVVDWSRRVAAKTAEGIEEDETLRADIDRNRSIAEVTSAVSREAQEGFSRFNITGEGGGIGGGAVGGNEKVQGALSFGYANNNSRGTVFGSSQGSRNVGGDMLQKAHDRTEQFASMSRSRRASIVSEVSVQEAERLSTRVVANYNHMHALSVLYFEIVQLYRVVSECLSAEPLLYLPVRPLNFTDQTLVDRYRALLARVALTPAARDALLGIVAKPKKPVPSAGSVVEFRFFNPSLVPELVDQHGVLLRENTLRAAMGDMAAVSPNLLRFDSRRARLTEVQVGTIDGSQTAIASTLTIEMPSRTQTIGFERWARPPKNPLKYLPEPGESQTAYRAILPQGWDAQSNGAVLKTSGGGPWQKILAEAGSTAMWPQMRFVFELLDAGSGQPTGKTASFLAAPPAPGADEVMQIGIMNRTIEHIEEEAAEPAEPPFDLAAHFKANELHYTMALLRTADPSLMGIYLSNLTLGGRPLMGQVDPVPVATVGNYLVFRWPALKESKVWEELCEARGVFGGTGKRITPSRESLVPIASGGVFAEAVLGRFNSAEKLDLTRFWNWQDSPIPILPPEIAPLQAGGRDGVEALRPGDLGAANLQVRAADALPDPAGTLAKALEMASKGDAFRDMSGMNNLLSAGGTAMTLAAQNARDFMKTAMESLSAYGARVNHGRDMDEREAKQAQASSEATGTTAPGGAPGGGGAPGSAPAPGSPPGTPAPRSPASPSAPSAPKPGNESQTFLGPQPERAPAPLSGGGELRLIVQVLNTSFADVTKHTTVPLNGRLLLRGVTATSSAGPSTAEGVVVDVVNGFGEVRVGRSESALLSGDLLVASAGSVGTVLINRDLPGTRDGWFERALIAETRDLNRISLTPTPLPAADSGTRTLRVELNLYWPADLQRWAKDPRVAATLKWLDPATYSLIPHAIPAGRDLTEAELQQVRSLIRMVVSYTRDEVQRLIRAPERRNHPVPIVALEQTQSIDAADRAFHNRTRWVAVSKAELRFS